MNDVITDIFSFSSEFQSRIRKKSILIPRRLTGTIPPNIGEFIVPNGPHSYSTVFADSFGPFRPLAYFQSTYKVMFILKETYLGNVDEEIGFVEGHDKAKEYVNTDWSNQPRTYQNAAKICFSLIQNRPYDKSKDKYDDVLDCFWDNACVINVNKFPCIAADDTRSDDKLIFQWAQVNESLIKEEIDLYRPNIIIGGHTLGHFVNCTIKGEGAIFDDSVTFLYPDDIYEMFGENLGKNNYAYLGRERLYINSKHPSASGGDQSPLILEIRKYWNSRMKI